MARRPVVIRRSTPQLIGVPANRTPPAHGGYSTRYALIAQEACQYSIIYRMGYDGQEIVAILRAARESKGLSQRELGSRAGVPQAHISKIENAAVDLRLSSLIALARVLDVEVMLVPRRTVAAVHAIAAISAPAGGSSRLPAAVKVLGRLERTIASVEEGVDVSKELLLLQRQLRELAHLPLAARYLETLKAANKTVRTLKDDPRDRDALRAALSRIHQLRNALMQASGNPPRAEGIPPAYALDEGNSDV